MTTVVEAETAGTREAVEEGAVDTTWVTVAAVAATAEMVMAAVAATEYVPMTGEQYLRVRSLFLLWRSLVIRQFFHDNKRLRNSTNGCGEIAIRVRRSGIVFNVFLCDVRHG